LRFDSARAARLTSRRSCRVVTDRATDYHSSFDDLLPRASLSALSPLSVSGA